MAAPPEGTPVPPGGDFEASGRKAVMEARPLVDDIQNYAQNIVDTVREPLLILGPDGRATRRNPGAARR